jgi:hypothetical protein
MSPRKVLIEYHRRAEVIWRQMSPDFKAKSVDAFRRTNLKSARISAVTMGPLMTVALGMGFVVGVALSGLESKLKLTSITRKPNGLFLRTPRPFRPTQLHQAVLLVAPHPAFHASWALYICLEPRARLEPISLPNACNRLRLGPLGLRDGPWTLRVVRGHFAAKTRQIGRRSTLFAGHAQGAALPGDRHRQRKAAIRI